MIQTGCIMMIRIFSIPNNGVEPNPISLLTGGSSSVGIHNFEGNFIAADTVNSADQPNAWWGNRRGIDTWALVPSQPVELNGRIVVLQADLEIAKTLTTTNLIAGGEISYTITVTNNGPSNVTGATVTDTFPTQIVNATWTCAITTGTGACTAASGSGDINTTVESRIWCGSNFYGDGWPHFKCYRANYQFSNGDSP